MTPIRLIAVDLDGTLLNSAGRVSEANRRAIQRAQQAGVTVVPCTGRSWPESRRALGGAPLCGPGVFVNGSCVVELPAARPLHHAWLDPELAYELIEELFHEPDAVLVFREAERTGHDYLVTGGGEVTANTHWWFSHNRLRVHEHRRLDRSLGEHALRVGLVGTAARLAQAESRIVSKYGVRLATHRFGAVQMPGDDEAVHIFEAFSAGVNKWSGIEWIAEREGVGPEEIAVIGDEVNDVPMFRAARTAIAVANAVPELHRLATWIAPSHEEDGVAAAIDRLLERGAD